MINTEIILKHAELYPVFEPCDAVKLAIQECFGAAHFTGTPTDAEKQVAFELSGFCREPSLPPYTKLGSHARLELKSPDVRCLGARMTAALFYLSAEDDKNEAVCPLRLDALRVTLNGASALFSHSSEYASLCKRILESYEGGVYESVSHSQGYRDAYKPSYRVLSRKYARLIPLLIRLQRQHRDSSRLTVAIDGPCASGKTTAAKILSRLLGAPIVPMDDFFLPPQRKTPQRLAAPGGNVDYERFSLEVLSKVKSKEAFTYGAYNCSDGSYSKKSVPPSDILFVEGVYSMRPEFRKSWDITVFSDISREAQLTRLAQRNPHLLQRFKEQWIPLEDCYFGALGVKEACDIILEE